MPVRNDLDGLDPLTVEHRSLTQVAEESAICRGMAGADLQGASIRHLHAHHGVMTDRRVTHANDGNRFDALTDDAVDEIANLDCRDRAFAIGRRDGRVGRRTNGTPREWMRPDPSTVDARDVQSIAEAPRAMDVRIDFAGRSLVRY